MRLLGVAVLGLFAGLFIGFALNEAIATLAWVSTGQVPVDRGWMIALRPVVPLCGALGVLVAVSADRRQSRR